MSLVIHTIVKDGIVVSADSRTTCENAEGNIRYNDSAEKIVPFPNQIIVSHAGDATITDKLNVTTFLRRLRQKLGLKVSLEELPLTLLNEYLKYCNKEVRDTTFLISGCSENIFFACRTYRVNTKEKTVSIARDVGDYGASFSGVSGIAYTMMNNANYNNMSLKEAIDLTETTLSANISIYKYNDSQIIGGEMKTYVIDTSNLKSGWLKNSNIVPDDNAPDNGRQIYSKQMAEKIMKNNTNADKIEDLPSELKGLT